MEWSHCPRCGTNRVKQLGIVKEKKTIISYIFPIIMVFSASMIFISILVTIISFMITPNADDNLNVIESMLPFIIVIVICIYLKSRNKKVKPKPVTRLKCKDCELTFTL